MKKLLLSFGLLLLVPLHAEAQMESPPPAVYLDCQVMGCETEHYRNEIRFVNWVRDRTDADVHLLLTAQMTGGGGVAFRMALIGLRRFAGDSATLNFSIGQGSTSAERRDLITARIAQGLMRYAAFTSAASRVRVSNVGPAAPLEGEEAPVEVNDPWNAWVFSTRVNTTLEGQARQKSRDFGVNASADRVTEEWKFSFDANGEYEWDEFTLSNGRKVESERRDYNANSRTVKAIASAWSAGLLTEVGTSSFNNQDLFGRLATVLEYSFYPYEDFSRRQLILQYSLGARYSDYEEETIYDRLTETRGDQQLRLSMNLRQPWGNARFNVSGAHLLDDVTKYNLSTSGNLNVRLVRGLTLDISGSYTKVRDQISIPKGDATDEEVLLRRRALNTGYRYRTQAGIRYTFGSVFNNVVNPRIPGPGGGGPQGGGGGF